MRITATERLDHGVATGQALYDDASVLIKKYGG
jgi:hypothetical protein